MRLSSWRPRTGSAYIRERPTCWPDWHALWRCREPRARATPRPILLAACRLGKVPATVPAGMETTIDSAISAFDADELRSKPIGFYTWSGALSAVFRQDRMLQSELKGAGGIGAIARAIHSDQSARASYLGYLALVSRLTNPLSGRDLSGPLQTVGSGGSDFPAQGLAFFPASRSHETDLVKKLYMDKPIPEGFNLVNEMVRGFARVRSTSSRRDLRVGMTIRRGHLSR